MRLPGLPRPTYANVVATLALVIAMSGTAYAVNTIGTSDIQNGAVTTPKLADEAVTTAKIAPNSIGSLRLHDNSVTLTDLVGADTTGAISFSLGANSCGTLNLGVPGMAVGQAALLTWTTTLPASIVLSPLRVVSTTQASVRACNESASPVSVSNAGVRIVTFG